MSLAVVSVENLKQNQETVTINIDSPKKVVDTDIAVTTEDVIEMVDLGEPKNGKGISPEITNQNVILGNIEARKAHNHSASTLKGDVDNIEPLPAEVPKRKSIFVSLLDFNIITSTFFEDKSSTLRKPTSSDFIRKSEDVSSRAPNPKKFNKTRSKSFSLGVTNRMTMKSREETLNNSWNFANYSFTLDPGAKDLKRSDILDVSQFFIFRFCIFHITPIWPTLNLIWKFTRKLTFFSTTLH